METWVTYWSGPTANDHEGETVAHVASDQFGDAGVAAGDSMYVISYLQGRLYVVTALIIGQLVTQKQAEKALRRADVWEAEWHAIARPRSARRATMSAPMTGEQVASMVFIGKDGTASPPARNRHGAIDPQTFRTTRRVDMTTAALLEDVLAPRL